MNSPIFVEYIASIRNIESKYQHAKWNIIDQYMSRDQYKQIQEDFRHLQATKYTTEYLQKNKDKIAQMRQNYYKNNKELIAAKAKIYNAEHKDKICETKKQYYQENKAILNANRIKNKANHIINCDCGSIYQKSHKNKHEQTKKHLEYLLTI